MEEEEDDMYAPSALLPGMDPDEETKPAVKTENGTGGDAMEQDEEDEDEEGDEDGDDDSEDDFQIITERSPNDPASNAAGGGGSAAQLPPRGSSAVKIEAPSSTPQPGAPLSSSSNQNNNLAVSSLQQPPGRPISPHTPVPHPSHAGVPAGRPGSSYPEVKTSTLDLEGNPVLPATGKPIFSTDMDADFPYTPSAGGGAAAPAAVADTAPWRRPGVDMTDYYNFGFDEGTWAAYCIKQRQIRGEIVDDRKFVEQLQTMMGGGAGAAAAAAAAMGGGMGGGGPGGGAGPAGVGGGAGYGQNDMMTPEQMQQMMQMFGGAAGMGMPGMDAGMGQVPQQGGFGNQGSYGGGGGGGGRNQGGRGKRW